jgi:hypothetical protein
MRLLVIGLMVCLVPLVVFARDDTLVGPYTKSGAFIGPVVRFGRLDEDFGLFVGGRIGWIINHTFSIGCGGYVLVNDIEREDVGEDVYTEMVYGGLVLEYVFNPSEVIHFSVATLVGGGRFAYEIRNDVEEDYDSDAFFILEPEFNVILNVTRNFRLGLGGGFRSIRGLDIEEMTDSRLSGSSAVITLKLGKF